MNISIIPTGDEILLGIVVDTSSAYILQEFIKKYPDCEITRKTPVADKTDNIIKAMERCVASKADLVILTGGSGGGHRYSSTLSEDYTHCALGEYLDEFEESEIYGSNGHLWCKLVCGRKKKSLVINLPGPYVEACAALDAFLEVYDPKEIKLSQINQRMIHAVYNQYPNTQASYIK
jgi:molybdopterin biosynthesis enzyme